MITKSKSDKFTEDYIRLDSLIKESNRLHQEDVIELLKFNKSFIFINCPACQSSKYRQYFRKGGFIFCLCKDCETVFINPRPTVEMLMDFYSNSKCTNYWSTKVYPSSENNRRKKIARPFVNRVIKIAKKHNSDFGILADVGAGFGTFCEEMTKKSQFKKIIAIEPSRALAGRCRQKNLNVLEKPIEKVDLKGVSILTLFETIEHVFDPALFIKRCHKILKNNGLLIITTPNIKGFDLITLNKLSDNMEGPEHLNYFNIQSLSALLKRCGFRNIEHFTPGKLDAELVRKKILSGKLDIKNRPFLHQILIEEWDNHGNAFQKFLVKQNLSSHMWLAAMKT